MQHPVQALRPLWLQKYRQDCVLAVDLWCQPRLVVKTVILLFILLIFKLNIAVQMWPSFQNVLSCWGSIFWWGLLDLLSWSKKLHMWKNCFLNRFFVPYSAMMLTITILFWNTSKLYISNHKYGSFPQPLFITFCIWDSVVGIATRYELDGPGIESRWGRDIQHPSRPAQGPTQPPIQRVPGLFPGGKAAGAWNWPRTPI